MAKKCPKKMATKSSEVRDGKFTVTARVLTDEEVVKRFAKMGL